MFKIGPNISMYITFQWRDSLSISIHTHYAITLQDIDPNIWTSPAQKCKGDLVGLCTYLHLVPRCLVILYYLLHKVTLNSEMAQGLIFPLSIYMFIYIYTYTYKYIYIYISSVRHGLTIYLCNYHFLLWARGATKAQWRGQPPATLVPQRC